jgi:hypothetical protein
VVGNRYLFLGGWAWWGIGSCSWKAGRGEESVPAPGRLGVVGNRYLYLGDWVWWGIGSCSSCTWEAGCGGESVPVPGRLGVVGNRYLYLGGWAWRGRESAGAAPAPAPSPPPGPPLRSTWAERGSLLTGFHMSSILQTSRGDTSEQPKIYTKDPSARTAMQRL